MRIVVLSFLALFQFSLAAQAITLEELLKKHAEALGGLANINKITSAIIESETNIGGMEGKLTYHYEEPGKLRVDLNLPILRYVQACNGDDCWQSDSRGLTHELTGDSKRILITQMALDRAEYLTPQKFKGSMRLLDSMLTVEGFECYQIEIIPESGLKTELAIDKNQYLPRRTKLVTDMATVYSFPSDYRKVENVVLAFSSEEKTSSGISSGKNTVKTVTFNVDVPDSLFLMPQEATGATGESKPVTVHFDLFRNHMYFDASINGEGPYRFIFDTGAGGVGINKDLVDKLKLESLGEVEAQGVGGSDVSQVYKFDSLGLGEIELKDVPVYSMDLAGLQAMGTNRIDGIIGYDLVSRYAVTVDYERSQLIIHRDKNVDPSEWGSECRLSLDFQLPYIDARVNDSIIGRFRLDTGSGSTIDLNSPFVSKYKLIQGDTSSYIPVTAYGIGGGTSGLIGTLGSFELCESRIDSVLVNFSTTEKGIFAGDQTAGNIGAGILKRFAVTFDYPNEMVYFKPVANFERLNRIRNMAGFSLEQSGDTLLVAEISSGRSAENLLVRGDRIITIGSQSAIGMSAGKANALLIGAKNSSIEVEVLREGKRVKAELSLDSLY